MQSEEWRAVVVGPPVLGEHLGSEQGLEELRKQLVADPGAKGLDVGFRQRESGSISSSQSARTTPVAQHRRG